MDSRQFFDLTARVRELQVKYNFTRDDSLIPEMKEKTFILDEEIKRVKDILSKREAFDKLKKDLDLKTVD